MPETGSKIKPVQYFIDESFDSASSKRYTLCIRIANDHIDITLLDMRKNAYVALESYMFGKKDNKGLTHYLSELLQTDRLLQIKTYKNVIVCLVHPYYTFVPVPLFRKEDIEKYFLLNHTIQKKESIVSDYIKLVESQNIFSISQPVSDLLKEKYDKVEIHHYATSLIESLLLLQKARNERLAYLHVQSEYIDIVITEGKKLLLFNTFSYETPEDVLYYLLFVYDQLHLDSESTPVKLLGEVDTESAIHTTLINYINDVGFGERTDTCSYSYGFNDLPPHFYYDLLSLHLCAS